MELCPSCPLTENLLQLHDTGVSTNVMDSLGLSRVWSILKNLIIGSFSLGVGHVENLGAVHELLADGTSCKDVNTEGQCTELGHTRWGVKWLQSTEKVVLQR